MNFQNQSRMRFVFAGISVTGLAVLGFFAFASTTPSTVPASAATVQAPASFACRLPVAGLGQAGFFVMPGRNQVVDASAKPGNSGVYARGKGWIQAPARLMSVDGRFIAVADSRSREVIVSDIQGKELRRFSADVDEVIGWTSGGIVAWSMRLDQVWIIEPHGFSHVAFAANHLSFEAVSAAGIWSLSGGLWRMEPSTGRITRWYDLTIGPDGRSGGSILGFDAKGSPVVWDAPEFADGAWKAVMVTSPQDARVLATSSSASDFVPLHALGDAHGVWFTSSTGSIWLAGSAGLVHLGGSKAYVIAGPCL